MTESSTTAGNYAQPVAQNNGYLLGAPHHWIRAFVLAGSDIFAFLLAGFLFRAGRTVPAMMFVPLHDAINVPIDIFYVLCLLFVIVRYISGDYSRRRLFWDSARFTTTALIVASLPCFLIVISMPSQFSFWVEVESWTFLLFAIPCLRQTARKALDFMGLWRLPTAMIASSSRAGSLYPALSGTLTLGYDIRWLVTTDPNAALPQCAQGLNRVALTEPNQIASRLLAEGCYQAVVATDDPQAPDFAELIQSLLQTGISVCFIPSLPRMPLAGVRTSYFFGRHILLFEMHSSAQRLPQRLFKRVFDFVGSLSILILISPLIAIVMYLIRRHDGGPIFYAQHRVGLNGRHFRCWKFRTMAVDADQRLERWKSERPEVYEEFLKAYKLTDDPRVTAPGKWLRRSSIDELPQLFNVLCGEMSLVGPRPIPEQQLCEQYGAAAALYKTVRPGLTGIWQISGRNDTSLEERVRFDEWYILNWTFWYDIAILIQTAWIVFSGRGAY